MPETQDETLVTVPDQRGYAGIRIGSVSFDGEDVAVLRYTEAAAQSAGNHRYCIDGWSHWNSPSFFREHAKRLEDEAALHRAAADLIEEHVVQ